MHYNEFCYEPAGSLTSDELYGNLPTIKIFAPGGFTWNNKGDAALLLAMGQALEHEFGKADIAYTSFTPSYDAPRYRRQVHAMALDPQGFVARLIHRGCYKLKVPFLAPYLTLAQILFFLCFLRFWVALWQISPRLGVLIPTKLRALIRVTAESEVVVGVPGGYLMAPTIQDDYWLFHVANLAVPIFMGKRIALYSCSVGPFVGFHAKIARRLLAHIDLIIVREQESLRHLKTLNVSSDKIELAPDAAFAFADDGRGNHEIQKVLKEISMLPKPWIGISVRDHHFPGETDRQTLFDRYIAEVAQVGDYIADTLHGSVIFVPQCVDTGGSDVEVARMVHAKMQSAKHAVVLQHDLSPYALQVLYRYFDMMVGTRMHANILALTQHTPVVAIAYEHKTIGIMKMLGLEKYVLSISDVSGRLLGLFIDAWGNQDQIRSVLQQTIPQMRARALGTPKLIRKLLGNSITTN